MDQKPSDQHRDVQHDRPVDDHHFAKVAEECLGSVPCLAGFEVAWLLRKDGTEAADGEGQTVTIKVRESVPAGDLSHSRSLLTRRRWQRAWANVQGRWRDSRLRQRCS